VSILRLIGLAIGQLSGYHALTLTACNAMNTVSIGLKFGGQVYPFTGIDLIAADLSTTPGLEGMCLSAIFVLGSKSTSQNLPAGGSASPGWLVGIAFLKNVYSVFRSVDLPFVHPHLFNHAPDLRTLRQD